MESFGRVGRAFLLSAVTDAVVLGVGLAIGNGIVVLVGGILLAVSLSLGLAFTLVQRRLFGSPKALRKIALEGMPANATVTAVAPTAGRVGASPIMKVELNVNLQNVVVRTAPPPHKVHTLQVGGVVPVKVHPDEPALAVIAWDEVR